MSAASDGDRPSPLQFSFSLDSFSGRTRSVRRACARRYALFPPRKRTAMANNPFNTRKNFTTKSGKTGAFYSLPALARKFPNVKKMPLSMRIVLEAVMRNVDDKKVTLAHVEQLANWAANGKRVEEIPFVVARVVLQDFTGVPLLVDLAAMRSVAARTNNDPKVIEPLVPVDLVVDHSVMIDHFRTPNALELNMKLEFQRNQERYQ